MEEAKWLERRALEFLETSKFQEREGFYGLACFSLEQALQLFLKSRLLLRGVDYPRTHSVRRLIEILIEVTDEACSRGLKELSVKHELELALLEDSYITSRYVIRDFSKEEVRRLMSVVEEVMKYVRENNC